MNYRPAKSLAFLLAAILMLPGPALACTGVQNCAMPCCRSGAGVLGPESPDAGAQPGCCQTPEQSVAQCSGPGQNPAAYTGGSSVQAPTLEAGGQANPPVDPPACCNSPEAGWKALPQKVPLYLKILSLLI